MIEDPLSPAWEYWAALVIAGLGFAVAYHSGRDLPARGRSACSRCGRSWPSRASNPASCATTWATRTSSSRRLFGGLVAFGWAPHRRTTAWLIGLLCLTALFASLRQNPAVYVAPFDRAERLVDQALTLSDGTATNEAIAQARDDSLRRREARAAGLRRPERPCGARRTGRRRSPVGATPGLVAASGLPGLFGLQRLRSTTRTPRVSVTRWPAAGPAREHPSTSTVATRRGSPPGTMRALLCHFRPAATGERWLLLEPLRPAVRARARDREAHGQVRSTDADPARAGRAEPGLRAH